MIDLSEWKLACAVVVKRPEVRHTLCCAVYGEMCMPMYVGLQCGTVLDDCQRTVEINNLRVEGIRSDCPIISVLVQLKQAAVSAGQLCSIQRLGRWARLITGSSLEYRARLITGRQLSYEYDRRNTDRTIVGLQQRDVPAVALPLYVERLE